MRKFPIARELTTVLGKQGRRMLRLKIPPPPRAGAAEKNSFPRPRHHTLASALLEITPLPAASPPVPDVRAVNLVGRFFLPLVPIETFLQAPIWDRAQRECERLTSLLAPRCAEGQGRECEAHQEKAPAAAHGGDALGTGCPRSQVSPREGAEDTTPALQIFITPLLPHSHSVSSTASQELGGRFPGTARHHHLAYGIDRASYFL